MRITLSKTDYILYRECPKNVWYKIHRPDIYSQSELSDFEKSIMETGNEVEQIARKLFPSGILIERRDEKGQETTRDYIAKVLAFERLFYYRVFKHSQQISSDRGFSYTVKKGDTLSRIANRCGTSVKDLLATNDVDPLRLKVGQKIWVRY